MIKNIIGTYHVTFTQIRNIKVAYNYCKKNNIDSCKVNMMNIFFNFTEKTGFLMMGKEKTKFSYLEEELGKLKI